MYLENLVFDALDPQRLGRFWEELVGGERLSDGPDGFETRLTIEGGPVLDLCFQPVPERPGEPLRMHVDVNSDVEQLLARGARRLDIGQGDVPWVVLADPEGNPFCVMEDRDVYRASGPIAALPLDSADPARDAAFWAWLTGWTDIGDDRLRHPSLLGPLLELCPESSPKTGKNRLHLDVRLEAADDADAVEEGILTRGGARLDVDWGELPWRSYTDPSGNELCVLPSR